jgi:hypothetical protein
VDCGINNRDSYRPTFALWKTCWRIIAINPVRGPRRRLGLWKLRKGGLFGNGQNGPNLKFKKIILKINLNILIFLYHINYFLLLFK